MAARNEDLEPETGRDLCRVRKDDERKGYRKDILTDNLSERDAVFFCNRCQGMMREVCISSGGEQLCSCCKKGDEQANPNIQMDNMILSFKCSCPLIARGCKWLGVLGDCQNHLDTCSYVYETCKLRCGVVLQRNELSVHEMEKCPQRIVECEHCNNEFESYELHTHLDKCPKMEVSCELKCGKIMCREDMTQHLKQECGLMVEMCKLECGKEMTRNELRIHVTDTCVQRLIQCEHCKGDFKFCDMSAHLDVCPKMEVSCELKCGVVMCREVMTQHLEVDCPEKAIECPYAKYKCVGLIKRKDMSKHLEERRMEHLELKLNDFIMESSKESEINAKQKEKISELSATIGIMSQKTTLQSATIEKMSQKITLLENEIHSLKKVMENLNSIPIKLDWIAKLPGGLFSNHARKQFVVAGYQFEFDFYRPYYNQLQIRIYPQNGFYYEKLKWPFKAKFTTRLRSNRNPTVTKEFKSEVIVVERKDFNSDSKKYFDIAKIWSYQSINEYLTDDVAEFEIHVVFV